MSASQSAPPLVFGLVVLDVRRRELTVKGGARYLRPTSFDVLVYLAANPDRAIERQELVAAVWNGSAPDDGEMARCLAEIRSALEPEPYPITIVPGGGYRFAAEVRCADPGTDPHGTFLMPGDPAATDSAEPKPVVKPIRRHRWGWLIAGTAVIAIGGWLVVLQPVAPAEPAGTAPVRAAGLAPQVTLNMQVVQLMVAGNAAAMRHAPQDVQEARAAYEQAVRADPGYAPAYGSLASTLATQAALGIERPEDVLPVADAYARRSIALDGDFPLGWSALASTQVQWTRNWAGAEAGYRRALLLDPTGESASFQLAQLLAAMKRPAEALELSLAALERAPASAVLHGSVGLAHYLAGRPQEALPYFDQALTVEPAYPAALVWQARALVDLGDTGRAMAAALRYRAAAGGHRAWIVGVVHARAGQAREARQVLDALAAHAKEQYVPAIELAYLHLAVGQRDDALTWLERGLEERSRWMDLLAVDPAFEALRDQPRFRALAAALRFPEAP